MMKTLALKSVSKQFGGVEAVKRLTMDVPSGKIVGLIGPNGAGKTTVINMIAGLLAVTDGRIVFGEDDITEMVPYKIAQKGIARTFQNVRLLKEMSVLDNIMVGFHRKLKGPIIAALLGFRGSYRQEGELRRQAESLLSEFGMRTYARHEASALPYGHQRLVEIMRALALGPEVLLLDEPVAGMTDTEAEELAIIFRKLRDQGLGILLIEHNMTFVMNLCDEIYVINHGELIAQGSPELIQRDSRVVEAYLGD